MLLVTVDPSSHHRFGVVFLEKLGTTVSLMLDYNPQANGQLKRVKQEVEKFLRNFCTENSLRHLVTQLTPLANVCKILLIRASLL